MKDGPGQPRCRASTCVRSLQALVAAFVLLPSAQALAADHPHIRLRYVAGDIATCPDGQGMQDRISAKLGYVPFDDASDREVDVRIEREAGGLVGRVVFRSAEGPPRQRRFSSTTDCAELATTIALAVAIAIDPASASRPEASPRAASEESPRSVAPAAEDVSTPMPVAERPAVDRSAPAPTPTTATTRLRVGVKLLSAFGVTPGTSVAPAATVGVRRGAISLDLEGRYHFASTAETGEGGVMASLALGLVSACVHLRALAACAIAGGGAMFGEGRGTVVTQSDTSPYLLTGARVGLELPLGRTFALQPSVEALVPIATTSLRLREVEVWRAAPIAAALGFGVVAHYP